tara:strand:- start:102 stop:581 length:480 start_codon:yes stop_codon:yes gene_type:complete
MRKRKRPKLDIKKFNFKYTREVLAVAAIVVGVLAIYQTFYPVECVSLECYLERVEKCKLATYVNEGVEASWNYEVKGIKSGECDVEVTLLNAKEGELELRQYEGNSMTCSYGVNVLSYPEKDLDSCHGILKENLQKIAIEKLYKYVVNNLGEIQEEFLL